MPDSILEKRIPQLKQYFQQNQMLLQNLAQNGQQPEALLITCGDSRVMVESALGLQAGEFFVHRNIAACVPPADQPHAPITAVLEFALHTLQVRHLIVCGHTDCGGVYALDTLPDSRVYPALRQWLDMIRPAQQQVDAAQPHLPPPARHRAIVQQHVSNQLANCRSYPFIHEREKQGKLEMHGWVHDLHQQTLWSVDEGSGQWIVDSGQWTVD